MRFAETGVAGAIVIDPVVHRDPRGFFLETFHSDKYAAAGLPAVFLQDNHSRSTGGTLRGLHMQILKPQGKLVRVVEGEIWDVALDVRPESPTFMKWTAATLSAENFRQLYIPPGCAHGFCVMSGWRRCNTSAPSCTTPPTRSRSRGTIQPPPFRGRCGSRCCRRAIRPRARSKKCWRLWQTAAPVFYGRSCGPLGLL